MPDDRQVTPVKRESKGKTGSSPATEDYSDVFIIAVLFIGLLLVIVLIARIAKHHHRNKFVAIINRYCDLKKDERCKIAVAESGLVLKVLAYRGEFLFLPLVRKGNNYRPRFESKTILEAENTFSLKIFSMLDNIVRKGMYNNADARNFCDIWGKLKDGRSNSSVVTNDYSKVQYLFSSLVSSGIIRGSDEITIDAFFLLMWECALDECIRFKGLVEENTFGAVKLLENDGSETGKQYQEFLQSGNNAANVAPNYQKAVYVLYEVLNQEENYIAFLMTAKEYLDNGNALWHDVYERNQSDVRSVVEIIERQRYVRNLLFDKSSAQVRGSRLTIGSTDTLDPVAFEKMVALIFRKMGYSAETTKVSGDQGVDVIAQNRGKKVAIQAKRYSGAVGNKAVQEVIAGKQYYQADEAYVVTNSDFTKSAIELAKRTGVKLWNRNALAQMLDRYPVYVNEIGDSGYRSEPTVQPLRPVEIKAEACRIDHPHYVTKDESECSSCGARFRGKPDICPECGSLFTKIISNNDEWDEEFDEQCDMDEEDERHI